MTKLFEIIQTHDPTADYFSLDSVVCCKSIHMIWLSYTRIFYLSVWFKSSSRISVTYFCGVDPVSFFRTIVFSRKRFILTKAFSKTLSKKRNWKCSKAFLCQRKRNWHFTNAFLTELKRFRNLSKASQTKLKIVDCVFVRSFSTTKCVSAKKRFNFQRRFEKRY